MKIECDAEKLASAVAAASKVVNTHTTVPLLTTILISAKPDGTVGLRATDLETTLERSVPGATVIEPGESAIPAKLLSAYLDRLPAGMATLTTNDDKATLVCGKAHVDFLTLPAVEFPLAPERTGEFEVVLTGSKMKDCVRATEFAASSEEARGQVLMGILLSAKDGRLTMVATDGYKLSHRSIVIDDGSDDEQTLIVPAKAMTEVARNVGAASSLKMTLLGAKRNQVRFESPEAAITVRCVDGNYPNYSAVIPQGPGQVATVKSDDLVGSLRRARIIADDRASAVVLEISEGKIGISVENSSSGSASEEIETEGWVGEPVKISFNAQFMVDALDRIDSEVVDVQIGGPLSPAIMRPAGDTEGTDHFVILMPLRT